MICNSFIAVLAAGFMLTSKNVNSFEMIIVARFLFGYSAGKLPYSTDSLLICFHHLYSPCLLYVTCRLGNEHSLNISWGDFTQKDKRDSDSDLSHFYVTRESVWADVWVEVSTWSWYEKEKWALTHCQKLLQHIMTIDYKLNTTFHFDFSARSLAARTRGTFSLVSLHFSPLFRLWCCLFFLRRQDIYS